MKLISNISLFIENLTSIPAEYIKLITMTFISIAAIRIVKLISVKIYFKTHKIAKDRYIYNKKFHIINIVLIFVAVIFIWESQIKNFMTLISFISAGFAIALREIILNFFAGIYIRISKPFVLEDRIEVNGLKGDVVNINVASFDVLEIGDRVNGEQSTGRIAHIPNSIVFLHPVKNYVEAFKYVWNELTVKVILESDIYETKAILYKIIKKNSIIQDIPDKMKCQVNDSITSHRIYFNNLKPIIYTAIVDDHIELYLRYLVHPKKSRNVENTIWIDIINEYKNKTITLYKRDI